MFIHLRKFLITLLFVSPTFAMEKPYGEEDAIPQANEERTIVRIPLPPQVAELGLGNHLDFSISKAQFADLDSNKEITEGLQFINALALTDYYQRVWIAFENNAMPLPSLDFYEFANLLTNIYMAHLRYNSNAFTGLTNRVDEFNAIEALLYQEIETSRFKKFRALLGDMTAGFLLHNLFSFCFKASQSGFDEFASLVVREQRVLFTMVTQYTANNEKLPPFLLNATINFTAKKFFSPDLVLKFLAGLPARALYVNLDDKQNHTSKPSQPTNSVIEEEAAPSTVSTPSPPAMLVEKKKSKNALKKERRAQLAIAKAALKTEKKAASNATKKRKKKRMKKSSTKSSTATPALPFLADDDEETEEKENNAASVMAMTEVPLLNTETSPTRTVNEQSHQRKWLRKAQSVRNLKNYWRAPEANNVLDQTASHHVPARNASSEATNASHGSSERRRSLPQAISSHDLRQATKNFADQTRQPRKRGSQILDRKAMLRDLLAISPRDQNMVAKKFRAFSKQHNFDDVARNWWRNKYGKHDVKKPARTGDGTKFSFAIEKSSRLTELLGLLLTTRPSSDNGVTWSWAINSRSNVASTSRVVIEVANIEKFIASLPSESVSLDLISKWEGAKFLTSNEVTYDDDKKYYRGYRLIIGWDQDGAPNIASFYPAGETVLSKRGK